MQSLYTGQETCGTNGMFPLFNLYAECMLREARLEENKYSLEIPDH